MICRRTTISTISLYRRIDRSMSTVRWIMASPVCVVGHWTAGCCYVAFILNVYESFTVSWNCLDVYRDLHEHYIYATWPSDIRNKLNIGRRSRDTSLCTERRQNTLVHTHRRSPIRGSITMFYITHRVPLFVFVHGIRRLYSVVNRVYDDHVENDFVT